jgi:tetratricopeptide (TPR) repeat protein/cellulose biosynthesis protein BcsQ
MSEPPYIFTFFSYKGGVGRSMALVNTAYELAGFGRHVLVIDLDLEAPGISSFLAREDELNGTKPCDALDLVAWARERVVFGHGADAALPELTEYAVPVKAERLEPLRPQCGTLGRLDVVPVHEGRDFVGRLKALDLAGLGAGQTVAVSEVLHSYLKTRRFEVATPDYYSLERPRSAPYDYVLVDSRTGFADITGLCVGPLADRLVVVLGLNHQNVDGTRRFLETVGLTEQHRRDSCERWDEADVERDLPVTLGPKPTLVVASPVPAGEITFKRRRIEELAEALGVRPFILSYHPLLALRESLFVRDFPEEYLATEYVKLAFNMMATVNDSPAQLAALSVRHWNQEDKTRAIEDVVRLAPANPMLAKGAFERLRNALEDLDEDGYQGADRLFRTQIQLDEANTETRLEYSNLLLHWAERRSPKQSADLVRREAIKNLTSVVEGRASTPGHRMAATMGIGAALRAMGDMEGEIAQYSKVVESQEATPEQRAAALVNRGLARGALGDDQGGLEDYDEVIAMEDLPHELRAHALIKRATARSRLGDNSSAIRDYSTVCELEDAPVESLAKAHFNRGVLYAEEGNQAAALDDYTSVIDMKDAPVDLRTMSMINRGVEAKRLGDHNAAIRNYTAVVDLETAPPASRSRALLYRGMARMHLQDHSGAIEDFSRVIGMDSAPEEDRVRALASRGTALMGYGQFEEGIAELSTVLEMQDIPADARAQAHFYRALGMIQIGRTQDAMGDLNTVIGMETAPPETKARALSARGSERGRLGETQGAIADYKSVVDIKEAPREAHVEALGNVGWLALKDGDLNQCIAASKQALELDPESPWIRANLALAHLLAHHPDEAVVEYEKVLRELKSTADLQRSVIDDLEAALEHNPDVPAAAEVRALVVGRRRQLESKEERENEVTC